jgi:rhodanese-related sulfurtransferase
MEAVGQNEDDSILNFVNTEEFIIQMKLNENHTLFDVRTWMEYKKSRIPHAVNAENKNILFAYTDTMDFDKSLFLYCATNFRSKAAGRSLSEKGFNNIFILDVGFNGWKASGKEIDKTRPKRSKHQIKKSII